MPLDQLWEEQATPILGSVLYDQGRFRMWYRGGGSGPKGGLWCYAESDDGLTWNKPALELIEYNGSRQNNIYVLGQPQAFTPFVDPNEADSARRYKSAVNSLRIDTALAYSPDGLRWTQYRDGAAITGRASDTISQVLWDPFARVYRLYTRTDYGTGKTGEVRGTRDMVAAADADLADPQSWKTVREWCLGWETRPPVMDDGAPKRRERDPDYHRKRQLYAVNGWIHEGVQFALLWGLETGDDETMNAYLATTRGHKLWDLRWVYGGQPLIRRGSPGSFDSRWIQPAPTVVTWNDRHWLYYAGLARNHQGQWAPNITGPSVGIGLATIRRDGFISLSAGTGEAFVTTKPIQFRGSRLTVNMASSARGHLRVEIQDETGQPLPGFSLTDSIMLNGDHLVVTVQWKQGADVSRVALRPVRLRLAMKESDLFAMQFQ